MRCESCGKVLASGAYRTPCAEHEAPPSAHDDLGLEPAAPVNRAQRRGPRAMLLALVVVLVASAVSLFDAVIRMTTRR